jgi:hypothetical protein
MYILANSEKYKPLLPNYFISLDEAKDLSRQVSTVKYLNLPKLKTINTVLTNMKWCYWQPEFEYKI